MNKNYKLTIQYDGTRYKGWQSQKSTDITIQGKLNAVFSQMEGKEVELQGSGRTDAGVHAVGQVASVHLAVDMTIPQMLAYVNHYLPEDIGVVEMEEVPERFHARLSAKQKTYMYRIFNSNMPNVFERKWMYTIEEPLDLAAMKRAAACLEGTHDFAAFCTNHSKKKSTVRTIYKIDILQKGQEVDVCITGNGFLHNMVRIIVGTLVEAGMKKRKPEEIGEILSNKKRENAGITMPAKGLTLQSVEY
ncbi:tRNA pseudouridine(38-40) synthase TruA [Roseburia sp. 499]|uniref:tRNA pseudouridine(38-40) synthase TruA n=1 Tax=Roseburia sp. 499 TaxID=1261634 RepID=UPI000950E9F1|nr:tRNA pseudouridine(38-40) synthase TruA [Roseburia sp. 499]WVK70504.1 tRNA pseudouridine(38-40) synthase TruA [Roseburia sp. 499]